MIKIGSKVKVRRERQVEHTPRGDKFNMAAYLPGTGTVMRIFPRFYVVMLENKFGQALYQQSFEPKDVTEI